MNLIEKYVLPGKKMALFFYIRGALHNLVPRFWLNASRRRVLRNWEKRADADYLRWHRDIYCRLEKPCTIPEEAGVALKDVRMGNFQSRYAVDAQRSLRYFPGNALLAFKDGDVWENPVVPTLIKARRLNGKNEENAVILNLDSIRHWLNPHDNIPFDKKIPKLFFRGDIFNKPARVKFFEQWADNGMFDLGDTNRNHPSRWQSEFVSIPEHFKYKFILALEGYDMASSLQWIMASGCVPVMPKPTVEGWLMHSQLVAGRHYIEIAPDFSDVGDVMRYYIGHPDEARMISEESRKWALQFNDRKREKIISLLVVDKYLSSIAKP